MLPYKNPQGGRFVASLLPVASYVAFGYLTAALPDGRKAGDPLSDGISPTNGTDINGPTAVFKSVTAIDHERCPNGVIFNQKFSPTVLESEDGIEKFIHLIRAYILLKGGHIQFNILSAETLRKAQKEPSQYAGLVVRVAGYSAFFNELSKEVQDTIIERTEQYT
jgi:formate C-acetyltransferase